MEGEGKGKGRELYSSGRYVALLVLGGCFVLVRSIRFGFSFFFFFSCLVSVTCMFVVCAVVADGSVNAI